MGEQRCRMQIFPHGLEIHPHRIDACAEFARREWPFWRPRYGRAQGRSVDLRVTSRTLRNRHLPDIRRDRPHHGFPLNAYRFVHGYRGCHASPASGNRTAANRSLAKILSNSSGFTRARSSTPAAVRKWTRILEVSACRRISTEIGKTRALERDAAFSLKNRAARWGRVNRGWIDCAWMLISGSSISWVPFSVSDVPGDPTRSPFPAGCGSVKGE